MHQVLETEFRQREGYIIVLLFILEVLGSALPVFNPQETGTMPACRRT